MLDKVLTGNLTFTSLKPCDLSSCTKREIRAYFDNSYDLNESIFTGLKDEKAFYLCADRLRLPLIFYYGHTACVYVNKLILAGVLQVEDRIDIAVETLFETGVDEMSWDDLENYRMGGKFQWPSLDEVVGYRRKVRNLIHKIIDRNPLELPVTFDSKWWSLFMGMEHERIHLETSSVLIRQLPVDMLQRPPTFLYGPKTSGKAVMNNPLIRMSRTNVTLGKPLDFPSYGWDNEYGRVDCSVPDFEANKFMVTNREFLAFIGAGGYGEQTYWTPEGWGWREYRNVQHPCFWVCNEGCRANSGGTLAMYSHCKAKQHLPNGINSYCNGHSDVDDNGHQGKDEGGGQDTYRLRLLFNEVPMAWDWPVEVNYHEAKAFCTWKGVGYRLPSEAEHNALRGAQERISDGVSCDIIYQEYIDANLNFQYGSSTPVNFYRPNQNGFHDVFGNAWEWTEDHFNGLPGTLTSAIYDDFSTPCFDGFHNVILGGSWISTGDEASRFARFAFRRHFFQHAGFRLARSVDNNDDNVDVPIRLVKDKVFVIGYGVREEPVTLPENLTPCLVDSTNVQYGYERPEALETILHKEWEVDNPQAVAVSEAFLTFIDRYNIQGSTIFLGCGTGRSVLPLSTKLAHLLAVDFSARFVDVCLRLQNGEEVPLPAGGTAKVPATVDLSGVLFKQLTWLPNELGTFDCVILTHLDRVLNARAWLRRMNEMVKTTGILMIADSLQEPEVIMDELGGRFKMVEELMIEDGEKRAVCITAWQHK